MPQKRTTRVTNARISTVCIGTNLGGLNILWKSVIAVLVRNNIEIGFLKGVCLVTRKVREAPTLKEKKVVALIFNQRNPIKYLELQPSPIESCRNYT